MVGGLHPSGRCLGAVALLLAAALPALAQPPAAAPGAEPGPQAHPQAHPQAGPRREMVRVIGAVAAFAALPGKASVIDSKVLEVMAAVPRHEFVPDALRARAYDDRPLPIGYGQTISQPYIVALMTDLLDPREDHKVLEIGTGSGYQAAVLSPLAGHVYSIEIVPALADGARARLAGLGYANVTVRGGDGYYGWPEEAPFDGIVVTAAAGHVPPPLVAQLRPGGRMILPVGPPFMTQHLVIVQKSAAGEVTTRMLMPVVFVPLTGGH